ncbi:unnamed protein product, partial [Brassica oleracea var. botrytis]
SFSNLPFTIYGKRNSRIFTGKASPVSVVQTAVDRQLRDRLLSIPPSPRIPNYNVSL